MSDKTYSLQLDVNSFLGANDILAYDGVIDIPKELTISNRFASPPTQTKVRFETPIALQHGDKLDLSITEDFRYVGCFVNGQAIKMEKVNK